MHRLRLPLMFGLMLWVPSCATGTQKDTDRLAADLKPLRHSKSLVMDFAEYDRIQHEYLAWIDSRINSLWQR